jgi:hypothetical protein
MGDLMPSAFKKLFPFSILLGFLNSQKPGRAKAGEYSGWSMGEMLFPAKNYDTQSEPCTNALLW